MTDSEILQAIYKDTQELRRRITSLELTIESETNKNIMRVAEGHLDLSRKLDDALKADDIRKIKEKLETIA